MLGTGTREGVEGGGARDLRANGADAFGVGQEASSPGTDMGGEWIDRRAAEEEITICFFISKLGATLGCTPFVHKKYNSRF